MNTNIDENIDNNSRNQSDMDNEGEKLFDQFFKLNNSKSDSDVLKENFGIQQLNHSIPIN